MKISRLRGRGRAIALAAVVGGAALALSACTLTVTHPTTVPQSSSGQAIGTLVVKLTGTTWPVADALVFTLHATGGGQVTFSPADSVVRPQVTSGHVTVPSTCEVLTAGTKLTCPSLQKETKGTATLVIRGLEVDAQGAVGNLEVTGTLTQAGSNKLSPSTGVAATFVPVAPVAPTFRSGATATFTAGAHGGYWVRLGGGADLSLVGAPRWLTIGTHSGYLSGTPPEGSAGVYTFGIVAHAFAPHAATRHAVDPVTTQRFTLTVAG